MATQRPSLVRVLALIAVSVVYWGAFLMIAFSIIAADYRAGTEPPAAELERTRWLVYAIGIGLYAAIVMLWLRLAHRRAKGSR